MLTATKGGARPKNTHVFERAENDFYSEPAWCSAALFRIEHFNGPIIDPCCGVGTIVTAAIKAGYIAHGSDLIRRGPLCDHVADFFKDPPHSAANIVSNPPSRALEFVETALRTAKRKVAVLVPYTVFSHKRARWFEGKPLHHVWLLAPRPSCPPGALIAQGMKASGGRTDYCWVVFERNFRGAPVLGRLTKNPRLDWGDTP
jgi:hypothetical protein